jgi:hypothetical protein
LGGAHLLFSGGLVVWAVHHLVAVVLRQDVRVVADALYEQVLPLSVVSISLHSAMHSSLSSASAACGRYTQNVVTQGVGRLIQCSLAQPSASKPPLLAHASEIRGDGRSIHQER